MSIASVISVTLITEPSAISVIIAIFRVLDNHFLAGLPLLSFLSSLVWKRTFGIRDTDFLLARYPTYHLPCQSTRGNTVVAQPRLQTCRVCD